MTQEVIESQFILVSEEPVVHLPELSLRGRGLRGFSGQLRIWMLPADGEVTVNIRDAIPHAFLQLIEYGVNLLAMWAFIIPVFHQYDRCIQ
jgi:hypothetical protein